MGGGNLVKLCGSKIKTKRESEKGLVARKLGYQNNDRCDFFYGGTRAMPGLPHI